MHTQIKYPNGQKLGKNILLLHVSGDHFICIQHSTTWSKLKTHQTLAFQLLLQVCVHQTCIVRIISHVTEMQALLKKSKPLTKQSISYKQTTMRLQGDRSKNGDHDPEALLKWIHSKLPHFSFFHSMNAASCSVFHSSVPPFEYADRQHTHPGQSHHTWSVHSPGKKNTWIEYQGRNLV